MMKVLLPVISCAVLLCLVCITGSAAAAHISIANVQLDAAGNNATADMVLDQVPEDGIAGYIINVSVANPAVAEITAVSIPRDTWAMTDVSTVPFTNGRIGGLDTAEVVGAGNTSVLLATLTIRGLSGGSTVINTTMVMISGDNGNNLVPNLTIDNPVITVAGAAAAGSGETGSSVQQTATTVAPVWKATNATANRTPTPTPTQETAPVHTATPEKDKTRKAAQPEATTAEKATKQPAPTASPLPWPVAAGALAFAASGCFHCRKGG